jgi:septum formation topological specificity factor MinE
MLSRFWLHNVGNLLQFKDQTHADATPRCFGAASAKERLDVVIRDAINAGDLPGPRYLANGKEMARRDGDLVAGITAYADGPEEMRQVINHHVNLGVDNIKLSMSGEEVFLITMSPTREPRTKKTFLDYRSSFRPGLLFYKRGDSGMCRRST